MPRQKQSVAKPPAEDATGCYIRDSLALLNGAADRAALRIIYGFGIFSTEDGGASVRDAAESLNDEHDALIGKIDAVDRRLQAEHFTDAQRKLLGEYENLLGESESAAVDSAYLLGIAVGRRLAGGVR